jgi:hypothetical protein
LIDREDGRTAVFRNVGMKKRPDGKIRQAEDAREAWNKGSRFACADRILKE